MPKNECVPPLLADRADHKTIARWLQRETPDAVLAAETFTWTGANRKFGKTSARPFIAWLMHQPSGLVGEFGSLDLRPEQLGRVAVEMVVAQIHRNERGSPIIPHTVLIDAVWVEDRSNLSKA